MQGRKETKKDVAHPQFCPTPCLFSLLSSPAAGSWKKKRGGGIRQDVGDDDDDDDDDVEARRF